MDIAIITNDKFLQVKSEIFISEFNSYSNQSINLKNFQIVAWTKLNLRFGVLDWNDCNTNVELELDSDESGPIDAIQSILGNEDFQENIDAKICDILHVDVRESNTCHVIGESCQNEFDCCHVGQCNVEKICVAPNDEYCASACPIEFKLEKPEWKTFYQFPIATTLKVTSTHPAVLLKVKVGAERKASAINELTIECKPNQIYFVDIQKLEACESTIRINCYN